jgi:hypothetical protein
MKSLPIILFFTLVFASCCQEEEILQPECLYGTLKDDFRYHLIAPVSYTPNKSIYKVGDSLTLSMNFDSVYCMNAKRNYKIKNLPFRPYPQLYMIDKDTNFRSGFLQIKWSVDSIYNPRYVDAKTRADWIDCDIAYIDDAYKFELKMKLTTPGVYIMLVPDHHRQLNQDKKDENILLEKLRHHQWEGKCERYYTSISNVLNGDSHMIEYEKYLAALLEKVYNGRKTFGWVYEATYCFKVE